MLQIQDMDQITAPNSILAFWNSEAPQLPKYLYAGMLTPTPIQGDSVTEYFGQNHVPNGLDPTADDVKANFDNEKDQIQSDSYHVMGFKKGRQMSEQYMNQIRTALYDQSYNAGLTESLTRLTYKDLEQLLISAQLDRERYFQQELNYGFIKINGNGVNDYQDFHMPANHRLGVSVAWSSDATGKKAPKPIENLIDAKRAISYEQGTNEIMAIMNEHTFLEMIHTPEIAQGVNPNTVHPENMPVNPQVATRMMQEYTGMNIKIYDKGIAGNRFIPNDRVILIPSNIIGRLIYAPTNEQMNLTNDSSARIANSGSGITVTSYKSINPTGQRIIVSQKILPLIDKIREIETIDVSQGNHSDDNYTVAPLNGTPNPAPNTPNISGNSSNNGNSNSASNSHPKSSNTQSK